MLSCSISTKTPWRLLNSVGLLIAQDWTEWEKHGYANLQAGAID